MKRKILSILLMLITATAVFSQQSVQVTDKHGNELLL
jgi:hypothetical protein